MSGGLCLYEGLFGITGFVIGQRTAEDCRGLRNTAEYIRLIK